MKDTVLLAKLKKDKKLRRLLRWPFDFEPTGPSRPPKRFSIKPTGALRLIARDGAGGLFLLYGPERRLLYVSSEGQAGLIAVNLEEGLRLMAAYPYWRDLLKFSGGGKLKEMAAVAPYVERDMAEEDEEIDLDGDRATFRKALGLSEEGDPIASLHAAVSASEKSLKVLDRDGSEYQSLFNTFTVKSNPAWKRRPLRRKR